MPIRAKNNKNYGGNFVSQKYNPLSSIQFGNSDARLSSAILTLRSDILQQLGLLLPQTLQLVNGNWNALFAAEKNAQKPPLVVVSSNRSVWIKAGIAAAEARLKVIGKKNFTDVTDHSALIATKGQKVSPPLYCPKRIGAAPLMRNVYIVVHAAEYDTYVKSLESSGINVVGWNFQATNAVLPSLAGFGATRFAALEFCKLLRYKKGTLEQAWLFDDNVVALEAFPGLEVVEKRMTNQSAQKSVVGIGFAGSDIKENAQIISDWAKKPAKKPVGTGRSNTPNILQQAVLWNIGYLAKQQINFAPIYIASAEDLSLSRYFDRHTADAAYRVYKQIKVRKGTTTYDTNDGHTGAEEVKKARLAYEKYVSNHEAQNSGKNPAPPPVEINNKQTVASYVVKQVLPNASKIKAKSDENTIITAKCQAVEQITKSALGKEKFVTETAMNTIFCEPAKQLNGKWLQRTGSK